MRSRKTLGVLVLAVAGVCQAATADAATRHAPHFQKKAENSIGIACPPSMSPPDRIACFQTLDDMVREMIESQTLISKLQSGSGESNDTRAAVEILPSVVSTFEVKRTAEAVLMWSGDTGGVLTVRVGEKIPGGWFVQSIQHGVVRLRRGAEHRVLFLSMNGGGAPGSGSTIPRAGSSVVFSTRAAAPTSIPGFGAPKPAPGAQGGQ